MNVTQVEITYERYVPVSNEKFNNLKLSVTLKADLLEDDDYHEAQKVLIESAREQVRNQALPIIAHGKSEADQALLGLPEEMRHQLADYAYSVNRNGAPPATKNELDEFFESDKQEMTV